MVIFLMSLITVEGILIVPLGAGHHRKLAMDGACLSTGSLLIVVYMAYVSNYMFLITRDN